MTLDEAVEAIYEWFSTRWAKTTPVFYENQAATPPPDKPWCRLSVRIFTSVQHTLGEEGGRKFLRSGSIFVQLFMPINKGSRPGSTLASKVQSILEGVVIQNDIRCWNSVPIQIPTDGKWFQINVETNFEFEELK